MILMSRCNSNMSITENEEFQSGVHLFSTNENVYNHNKKMLLSLTNPIAQSIDVKTTQSSMDGDGSDELDMELLLSKDARVMLTSNLWIEASLVNGALGYVQNIVYRLRSAPPLLPSYVLVDFDS